VRSSPLNSAFTAYAAADPRPPKSSRFAPGRLSIKFAMELKRSCGPLAQGLCPYLSQPGQPNTPLQVGRDCADLFVEVFAQLLRIDGAGIKGEFIRPLVTQCQPDRFAGLGCVGFRSISEPSREQCPLRALYLVAFKRRHEFFRVSRSEP
jgi:hypothetical protein